MDNKYQNEKVYSISTVNRDKVYIGSSTKKLSERIIKHEHDYQHWGEGKRNYTSSFDIIEDGNYIIDLLENFSCTTKQELNAKEQEYIEKTPNCINKYKAYCGMTKKEYDKQRYATKINCECGGRTDLSKKPRHERSIKHQAYLNHQQSI